MTDLEKISEGIKKTGFTLEFEISEILESSGWNVINNKYYVDDLQNTVREIDLIAYKVTKVQHIQVYTTLIISCKKNEKDCWALLSKTRKGKEKNVNWLPVHFWSNDVVLKHMLNEPGWKQKFLKLSKSKGSNIFS